MSVMPQVRATPPRTHGHGHAVEWIVTTPRWQIRVGEGDEWAFLGRGAGSVCEAVWGGFKQL